MPMANSMETDVVLLESDVRVVSPRRGWQSLGGVCDEGALIAKPEALAGAFQFVSKRVRVREYLVTRLKRSDRLLLTLRYFEQLTLREIGAVLDRPEVEIHERVNVLMAALRHDLGFDDDVDGAFMGE
ncbi:MAG: sigma factor-like helix-turn-helix DNA-binding protein [Algisphaera sp.]